MPSDRSGPKGTTFIFILTLTAWICWQQELLYSIIVPIRHKHVSISVEAQSLRGIQSIWSWSISWTTHHASETSRAWSNDAIVTLINDEKVSISIQHDSCRSVQWYVPYRSSTCHGCCIQLSWSEHLHSVVITICDVKIQVNCDKDTIWTLEHVGRRPITTNAGYDDRFAHRWIQWFAYDLMLISSRTVEVVADIDKESRTVCTDNHRWRELCLIDYPPVHSGDWQLIVEKDLVISRHEETWWCCCIGEDGSGRSRASIAPDENVTGLTGSHENCVICIDKDAMRYGTNHGAIGESSCIRIPGCIVAEFRLIEWANYNQT